MPSAITDAIERCGRERSSFFATAFEQVDQAFEYGPPSLALSLTTELDSLLNKRNLGRPFHQGICGPFVADPIHRGCHHLSKRY
jgi:hypothetical protein